MSNKRILKVKEGCCLLAVAVFILVSLSGCLGRPGVRREERVPRPVLMARPRLITLTVEGADYVMLREFREKLSALREVGDVHQRKFVARQISELEIEYKDSMETLVDQMSNMSFSNFALDIASFDQTRISVQIIWQQ